MEVMLHLSPKIPDSRAAEVSYSTIDLCFRWYNRRGEERSLENWMLIKAGKKERKRKPDKKGRVIGVVAAVVILATIIPAMPVAATVPSIGVVPLTPMIVVPVTSASVVSIAPVIIAVVIPATAVVNGGMTRMAVPSLR